MPRRQVVSVDGIGHKAPIPLAVTVDNILFSSGIQGKDPGTGLVPEDPAGQARFMFQNVRAVMTAAGGSVSDIGSFAVSLTTEGLRAVVDEHWLAMFPDPNDRPARHTEMASLRGGAVMQCQIIAVLAHTRVGTQ